MKIEDRGSGGRKRAKGRETADSARAELRPRCQAVAPASGARLAQWVLPGGEAKATEGFGLCPGGGVLSDWLILNGLLHCGVDWQTPPTTALRGRLHASW